MDLQYEVCDSWEEWLNTNDIDWMMGDGGFKARDVDVSQVGLHDNAYDGSMAFPQGSSIDSNTQKLQLDSASDIRRAQQSLESRDKNQSNVSRRNPYLAAPQSPAPHQLAKEERDRRCVDYEPLRMARLFDAPSQEQTSPAVTEGETIYQQKPRFEGDLYTARWIQGEGAERSGWCGFCSTWLNMKDSTYWYHMHSTHGISYSTGRYLTGPTATRSATNSWQVLCGECDQWLCLSNKDSHRARTTYFRHAYKCHTKVQHRSAE